MPTIGAREANRSFSKILREAEGGKTVTITRNGRPVARLEPIQKLRKSSPDRDRAIAEMVDAMKNSGLHFGGRRFTRDEMHER